MSPADDVTNPVSAAPPVEDRRSHQDRRQSFHPVAVYPVGGVKLSILDLLNRFTEERWQRNGISRLADLHLKTGEAARYRLDGDLVALEAADRLTHDIVKGLVYPLLRADQIEKLEREYPQDVDAAFHLEEAGGMNFRINAFHDRDGLAAVIRSLPQTIPPIETLGFPEPEVLKHMLHLHQGLVVITGITGSGKSTTIASLLAELNKREPLRIITLEDPIEYVLKNDRCLISQREVGLHSPSFHAGLRSALREDPDVVVVGEIRDTETASLALSAAETGHLVFSTLHTRDAKGVITRIVDLFPAERSKEIMSQLSFSLAYVIAQKLVPRKDGKGRIATYEVLKNVPAISNLIRTGNWHQIYSTIQIQAKEHMITLEKHLMHLVAKGLITQELASQYANDPSQLIPASGSQVPVGA
ncbi:MAG: type IV pilus twitching motility protein PilT [Planctomycetota bacterium]